MFNNKYADSSASAYRCQLYLHIDFFEYKIASIGTLINDAIKVRDKSLAF